MCWKKQENQEPSIKSQTLQSCHVVIDSVWVQHHEQHFSLVSFHSEVISQYSLHEYKSRKVGLIWREESKRLDEPLRRHRREVVLRINGEIILYVLVDLKTKASESEGHHMGLCSWTYRRRSWRSCSPCPPCPPGAPAWGRPGAVPGQNETPRTHGSQWGKGLLFSKHTET